MIYSLAFLCFAALLALPVMVGFSLVSRRIDLRRLLVDKQLGGVSQARVQLLLVTISGASFYLAQTILAFRAGSLRLPDVPETWLVALGISNGIYISGKTVSGVRVLVSILGGKSRE